MRPALIVEDTTYIRTGSLIAVIPISSVVEKQSELDILIPGTAINRLLKDSLIKTRQISSFDKRRLIKFVGICDSFVFESVRNSLRLFFNLPNS